MRLGAQSLCASVVIIVQGASSRLLPSESSSSLPCPPFRHGCLAERHGQTLHPLSHSSLLFGCWILAQPQDRKPYCSLITMRSMFGAKLSTPASSSSISRKPSQPRKGEPDHPKAKAMNSTTDRTHVLEDWLVLLATTLVP